MPTRLNPLYPLTLSACLLSSLLPAQAALPEDSVSLRDIPGVSFRTMSGEKPLEEYWLPMDGLAILDQGMHCDCAYCACAAARSLLSLSMAKECGLPLKLKNYSYTFLRNLHMAKKTCCSGTEWCCPATISDVLRIMKSRGICTEKQFPNDLNCDVSVGSRDTSGAWNNRISGFRYIKIYGPATSAENIAEIKDAIARGNPVIAGIYAPADFEICPDGQKTWRMPDNPQTLKYHAVVVTGYNAGFFRVLNSYGADWCDGGSAFIPINDFMRMYAIGFVIDWECP